jgi:hypothetical protein
LQYAAFANFALIILKYASTSRKIFSAVLLLLYVFIALPVQLWHHHKPVSGKPVSELKIGKTAIDTQTQECKICQHTYTDYSDDAIAVNISTSFFYNIENNFSLLSYNFLHSASPGNKSPPVA